MRLLTARLACALLVFVGTSTWADDWPSRPVRIVIPYSAGGAVDAITRVIAAGMEPELGQPIVIEPKPGGEGNIAAVAVASAPKDGYTLLSSSSVLTTAPMLYDKLPWKLDDFRPVARFATSSGFITSSSKLPASTLAELADYGRANPGMPVGVVIGAAHTTFTSKLFARQAGIEVVPVPYPGAAQHMPDLFEGRVAFATVSGNLACSSITNPRVKVLAMTGTRRSAVAPDVPTTAEAGFPKITTGGWYGLHAPAGTPDKVIDRIASALARALLKAQVQQGLRNACVDSAYLAPGPFAAFLESDQALWRTVVRSEGTGIKQ